MRQRPVRPARRRRRPLAVRLVAASATALTVASLGAVSHARTAANTAGAAGAGVGGAPVIGFSPGHMLLSEPNDQVEGDLAAAQAVGARWIRIDIAWSNIEASRGHDNWAATDRVVMAARRRGLDVLALVAYTPAWARAAGTDDKTPPTDAADFARFSARAAARYLSVGVGAWEIWNEPNLQSFWRPAPDPGAYASLIRAASDAIRQTARRLADNGCPTDGAALEALLALGPLPSGRCPDPKDVQILSGGLAPAHDVPGHELAPETFLAGVYDAGAGSAFDAVAVHPYSYPELPTGRSSWNLFARLPRIRAVMDAQGDSAKPFWITEFGSPTVPGRSGMGEEDQAAQVEAAVRRLGEWPWLGPLFFYSLRDAGPAEGRSADDPEANFGLRFHDGQPKPAWQRLSRLLG